MEPISPVWQFSTHFQDFLLQERPKVHHQFFYQFKINWICSLIFKISRRSSMPFWSFLRFLPVREAAPKIFKQRRFISRTVLIILISILIYFKSQWSFSHYFPLITVSFVKNINTLTQSFTLYIWLWVGSFKDQAG